MTDNEIRIAIAEACGKTEWLISKCGYFYRPGEHGHSSNVSEAARYSKEIAEAHLRSCGELKIQQEPPPDYPNDLNAMHEAWHTLNRKQRIIFSQVLRELVVKAGGHAASFNEDVMACVENATPHQRAEAFLRTIGKWKP